MNLDYEKAQEMIALSIDDSILAHLGWRERFQTAIEGIDADRLADLVVADADGCLFGQWLASPEHVVQAQSDELARIKSVHNEFHRVAADIVELLHRGEVDAAQHVLDTLFAEVSGKLTGLLRELR